VRRISVGLVVYVDDEVAADHEALVAWLEARLLGDGVIGSILVTADITERVAERLEELRARTSTAADRRYEVDR